MVDMCLLIINQKKKADIQSTMRKQKRPQSMAMLLYNQTLSLINRASSLADPGLASLISR